MPSMVGALTRLRLFVSLVKPQGTQAAASVVPLFTLIRTTIVDPALNLASADRPSPKTLNSERSHPLDRSGKRSSPLVE